RRVVHGHGGTGAGGVPAVEQDRAQPPRRERDVRGEDRRRGDPYQVQLGAAGGQLVEVVHAPAAYPVGVPPGAEVLHVQVADGRYRHGGVQVRQQFGGADQPQVVGTAQEAQDRSGQRLVLGPQVVGDERDPPAEPALVLGG